MERPYGERGEKSYVAAILCRASEGWLLSLSVEGECGSEVPSSPRQPARALGLVDFVLQRRSKMPGWVSGVFYLRFLCKKSGFL